MKNLLRKWLGITELTQSMLNLTVEANKSTEDLRDEIFNDLEYEIERKVENEVDDIDSLARDLRYDLDDLKDAFEEGDLKGGVDEALNRIEGLTYRVEALEESVSNLSILDRLEAIESKLN